MDYGLWITSEFFLETYHLLETITNYELLQIFYQKSYHLFYSDRLSFGNNYVRRGGYELRITMKSENVVVEKSFRFSIRIINLYRFLTHEKKELVLSKQLLRCGTGIGANIEEAIGGQSDKDFLSKISIAYKETRETIYWIKLLHATGFIDEKEMFSIMNDIDELARIIGKIQLTMKKKLNDP